MVLTCPDFLLGRAQLQQALEHDAGRVKPVSDEAMLQHLRIHRDAED
jgi:hypothetical protein